MNCPHCGTDEFYQSFVNGECKNIDCDLYSEKHAVELALEKRAQKLKARKKRDTIPITYNVRVDDQTGIFQRWWVDVVVNYIAANIDNMILNDLIERKKK